MHWNIYTTEAQKLFCICCVYIAVHVRLFYKLLSTLFIVHAILTNVQCLFSVI